MILIKGLRVLDVELKVVCEHLTGSAAFALCCSQVLWSQDYLLKKVRS